MMPGRRLATSTSAITPRIGSSRVSWRRMLMTIGGISSALTGRISPLMVRTRISHASIARSLASMCGLVR